MRPCRSATPAERDARAERRTSHAEEAGSGPPLNANKDRRQPFDWIFSCGVTCSLHFELNPRGVRQWRGFRDEQPWMYGGLELLSPAESIT